MGQHKKRRDKVYRAKHIQVPVMPDMQKEFMFAGHGSLAALRLAPNEEAFMQLAALLNVISVALKGLGRKSLILDSGMRALQDVGDRADATGRLYLGRYELPPIENAVVECERLVRGLDIFSLYNADIKARGLQKQARANPASKLS